MCHDADDSLANSDSYIPSSVAILCCQSCAGMRQTSLRLSQILLQNLFHL
jgi:hypothetical protein